MVKDHAELNLGIRLSNLNYSIFDSPDEPLIKHHVMTNILKNSGQISFVVRNQLTQ